MTAEAEHRAGDDGSWPVHPATVALVVLGFAAFHVWAASFVLPFPDEAYYWLWSTHPAVGYYDHPPMVAWWIALGTFLFGDTLLGVRAVFIAGVIAASAAIYVTARILFDRPTAALAAMWFNATILIAATGMIATPDGPSTLFWALAVMAFAVVVKTGRGAWWLAVGLFAGLGAASKYHVLFLGPGLLLALAADRDLRHWLINPWPWAGGLVALLAFSPVIAWNYQNDWVSFAKQFGRVVDVGTLSPGYLAEYLVGLSVLLNPLIAAIAAVTAWRWARGRLPSHSREVGALLLVVAPFLVYMAVHALHHRIDGNWLAPALSTLAIVGAFGGSHLVSDDASGRAARRWRAAVVPVGVAAALIAGFFLQPHPRFAIAGLDPGRPFHGWDAFADDVDRLRREARASWVVLDDYNYVAELSYHFRGQNVPVDQITERIRYGFRPPPGDDVIATRALVLLRKPAETYADCLPGLSPAGVVEYRGRPDDPAHTTFAAYTVESIAPEVFVAGCDRNARP